MKKIYVSEKDIKAFRDLFGTDYSGQEHTQEYMEAVHKWKKQQTKAVEKWKRKANKQSLSKKLIKYIKEVLTEK